jgi:hypothetical protein
MNTASLDLCKELYELSRWDDTTYTWYGSPHPERDDFELGLTGVHMDCIEYPAYDLGYLLRKLPDEATSKKHGGYHYFYMHHNSEYWYAYYGVIDTTEFMEYADTPENAADKLSIALFKKGILTKQ